MSINPIYEAGLAYEGSATPQVYLLMSPNSRIARMSPDEERAAADIIRTRSRTADDPDALRDLAATLDNLADEIESGTWMSA